MPWRRVARPIHASRRGPSRVGISRPTSTSASGWQTQCRTAGRPATTTRPRAPRRLGEHQGEDTSLVGGSRAEFRFAKLPPRTRRMFPCWPAGNDIETDGRAAGGAIAAHELWRRSQTRKERRRRDRHRASAPPSCRMRHRTVPTGCRRAEGNTDRHARRRRTRSPPVAAGARRRERLLVHGEEEVEPQLAPPAGGGSGSGIEAPAPAGCTAPGGFRARAGPVAQRGAPTGDRSRSGKER